MTEDIFSSVNVLAVNRPLSQLFLGVVKSIATLEANVLSIRQTGMAS